jgi:hypothetical protein
MAESQREVIRAFFLQDSKKNAIDKHSVLVLLKKLTEF